MYFRQKSAYTSFNYTDRVQIRGSDMMFRIYVLVAMTVMMFGGFAPVVDAKPVHVKIEGRSYDLIIPPKKFEGPRPTVFVLHGGGGTGSQIRKHFDFTSRAAKDGVVLVYPDGLKKHWNDGRTGERKPPKTPKPDDVAFITSIATRLIEDGVSVPGKMYVTGVSNGGMMTQRLLCDASDVFQAGVSIIANLPTTLEGCTPEAPRSILLINGDKDPLMPWNGGGVGFRHSRGLVISAERTFAHWQLISGCEGDVKVRPIANLSKKDGTYAKRRTATQCQAGREVEQIHVYGGGHNIPTPVFLGPKPGSRRYKRRVKLLGAYNHDFDARTEAWRFFKDNSLLD
jgi:polyhydroxybutyrate depolymerase